MVRRRDEDLETDDEDEDDDSTPADHLDGEVSEATADELAEVLDGQWKCPVCEGKVKLYGVAGSLVVGICKHCDLEQMIKAEYLSSD